MLITLLIYTIACSGMYVHPPMSDDNEIRWSDSTALNFGDFMGAPPANSPWAALTASYIYFTYSTSNGRLSSMLVYASFKKDESWMKTERYDVLTHEQLHFAITEYFARKLYAEAQTLKQGTKDVSAAANTLFNSLNEACDRMQDRYDRETNHGVNAEAQAAWKITVAAMLKEYDHYPTAEQ